DFRAREYELELAGRTAVARQIDAGMVSRRLASGAALSADDEIDVPSRPRILEMHFDRAPLASPRYPFTRLRHPCAHLPASDLGDRVARRRIPGHRHSRADEVLF